MARLPTQRLGGMEGTRQALPRFSVRSLLSNYTTRERKIKRTEANPSVSRGERSSLARGGTAGGDVGLGVVGLGEPNGLFWFAWANQTDHFGSPGRTKRALLVRLGEPSGPFRFA